MFWNETQGALALEGGRRRKIQEIGWYGVATEEKRKNRNVVSW